MFLRRVAATPDDRAFGYPLGDEGAGWLTWGEVGQRSTAIAAGLIGLGIAAEDRVAILAGTRLEWVLVDLGIMCAGAATTTVYPTSGTEDIAFILTDSGSRVLVAETAEQAAKAAGVPLEHVVLIDGDSDPAAPVPTISLAELERRGTAALAEQPDLVTRVVEKVRLDQLATLMYTSGTTGRPKGVELQHRAWCWQGVAQAENGVLSPDDIQLLWLPLSHSFGKTLLCGILHAGLATYVDGRIDKIMANLALVRPTLMCAAPRIFEKVYNAVVTTARAGGPAKARIFAWAVRAGKRAVALEQAGKPVPVGLRLQWRIADRLVFVKLRERMGGRMRVLVSGSAALAPEISEFFAAAGLPILEGYGLTETSAGSFVNRPGQLRIGTVGTVMGDLEVRLDTDGEVLLRGGPVMRGYHNLPEQTAEVFTEDGYFRTGDIGELDADGYLKITDRKKDLIKTSGGKYVAPSYIEGVFKAICPYVSQTLVIGDRRNFCTMLVTLDPDAIRAWAAGGPLEGASYAQIAGSPQAKAMVEAAVAELNGRLNRWETIKKVTILPRDLTVEEGDLTPSLKLKRRTVEKTFAEQIDAMYAGAVAQV
ncbi:MAG: long-chain fatty acid--CoA ligase [Micromonosporaceae bacterium]|nr:long-chain fatty acid--CoA ligase [Micromonosporaceae bacterium]